jgi:peptidoglycan/xylan/chitin deacetylase (PgdA/CDA1 family)
MRERRFWNKWIRNIVPHFKEWDSLNNSSAWIIQPPGFLRLILPSAIWRIKNCGKSVFLTFDDGPIPGVTPWVLKQLKKHQARATFFCVGDNIRKYPNVYARLHNEGMAIGCHSYAHTPGYRVGIKQFLADLDLALSYCPGTRLFRPPHGIIFPWWRRYIAKRGLRIVMWDVLSCDYDRKLKPQQIVDNVTHYVRPGSVIVFHDSLKAWPNLKVALPQILKWLKENGYNAKTLV